MAPPGADRGFEHSVGVTLPESPAPPSKPAHAASLQERVRRWEQESREAEQVVHLGRQMLARLKNFESQAPNIEEIRRLLRSVCKLVEHGEHETAEQLFQQAEEALATARRWLLNCDTHISPAFLRSYFEKDPPPVSMQRSLIRYFITKHPRDQNDRDKLDYLVTYYCRETLGQNLSLPADLRNTVASLFVGMTPWPLSDAAKGVLPQIQSTAAATQNFSDFDQLLHGGVLERGRTLKRQLGEEFYHPLALATVVRFNEALRRCLEGLLQRQLDSLRRQAREELEKARDLVRAVDSAYQSFSLPAAPPSGEQRAKPSSPTDAAGTTSAESESIEQLLRSAQDPQKEDKLRGVIAEIAFFVRRLCAEDADARNVAVPLRSIQLELSPVERKAFAQTGGGVEWESTIAIQYALGLTAWISEELVLLQQNSFDRSQRKNQLNALFYAGHRSISLLRGILGLIQRRALSTEATWSLVRAAHRLGSALDRGVRMLQGSGRGKVPGRKPVPP